MKISAEEKMMYHVMKAIYESGIPISFKGSMVLKACLMEAGYTDDTRHTVDIDGNWNSDEAPSAEQMVKSLQKAIDRTGYNLSVSLSRMFGEGRSAGFDLTDSDSGDMLFSMDIDVNRPLLPTKIYEVDGLHFRGVSPAQMLADKVAAVSSDKVFRRIKDIVDLYYLSQVIEFNKAEIMAALQTSGRVLEDFHGFLRRRGELEHAYEKFRFAGDLSKPPFKTVYRSVKSYIKDVLPREKHLDMER